MIRLEHVNKYFNRRRKNEIHVINDTTLSLEEKGLVALLGPSGCGKTTLLNVIGGLDKVNKGRIFVNGQKITRKRAGRIDKIRNLNIGYVFQNYNLVDNMTVFDNVAIALRMVGVRDKKEIEEKVNYVLEKVGMYRYRNRYADMLSGGERQRVGIARALVKNPAIVIADEPTGNLDSRNTLEVMNIIKSISEDRLVVLVTHEEKLAEFYATRIIRILDGKIVSDQSNDHSGNLDYRIDNRIYLRDIRDHKRLKTGNYNIDFYNDSSDNVHLDIVVRNGNIYIRTKDGSEHVEVIDEGSSIELIDGNYKEMTQEACRENSFDLGKLAVRGRRRYKSIFNPLTLAANGFKTVSGYNILKKILLVGFLVAAIFITYSLSHIFGVLNITDDEFIQTDKSYVSVISRNTDIDTYKGFEQNDSFDYVIPGDGTVSLSMPYNSYIQTMNYAATISGALSDIDKVSESDIVYGRLPENKNEIVVDKLVIQNLIKNDDYVTQAGFGKVRNFLDRTIPVANMHSLKIVGISDKDSPCIYADRSRFINLLANTTSDGESMDEDIMMSYIDTPEPQFDGTYIDYKLMKNKVELKKGSWPEKNYEVIVNEKNSEDWKIGSELSKNKINGHKLKVTGYYSDSTDSDYMLVNHNMIKYDLVKKSKNITISTSDKAAAIEELKAEGINAKDAYEESRNAYLKEQSSTIRSSLVMAGVVLLISFIEIFLIIRASFLSRIKEIGVYRAIGVKKADIYRMFGSEILAITTMAAMPGFLLTAYILYKVSHMTTYFEQMFLVSSATMAVTVIVIYGFNMLFGLLPVFRTIRKTPAAILSRTDI